MMPVVCPGCLTVMLFFLQNMREENERLKIKVQQLEEALEVLYMNTCSFIFRYLITTEYKFQGNSIKNRVVTWIRHKKLNVLWLKD